MVLYKSQSLLKVFKLVMLQPKGSRLARLASLLLLRKLVCMCAFVCVCVRACACTRSSPRLSIISGVMWHDMDPT